MGRGHWAKITKVGRSHWAEITVGRGHMYPSFFTIYHKRYWMMNVKIPHEEVTIGDLENRTKFMVNNNTIKTSSVHQKGFGNMNTPSEQNTVNTSNIIV